jgi:hypothetical protein
MQPTRASITASDRQAAVAGAGTLTGATKDALKDLPEFKYASS